MIRRRRRSERRRGSRRVEEEEEEEETEKNMKNKREDKEGRWRLSKRGRMVTKNNIWDKNKNDK